MREQHDEVDQAMRERHAVTDAELDADEVGRGGEQRMDPYSSGATNRNENSIGSVMPVRKDVSAAEIMMPPTFARFSGLRAVPHGDRGSGQSPHLEEISAGQIACGGISGDVTVDFAAHDFAAGRVQVLASLEEERHVPDVMQAEGNE